MAGSIAALACQIQQERLTEPHGVAARRMEKRGDGHGTLRTEPLPCTPPLQHAIGTVRAAHATSSAAAPPSTQCTRRRRSGAPTFIGKDLVGDRSTLWEGTMRLVAATGVVFLCVIEILPTSASALEIRPECAKMRDKIGCTCALNNGGGIRPYGKGWYSVRGRSIGRAGYPNQAFTLCVAHASHTKL